MRSLSLIQSDVRRFLKPLVWNIRARRTSSKIGFILGSQRSGTNMLNDAFDRDWSCQAFGEDHGLALGPSFGHHLRWRWRPLESINETFRDCRAPLIIAKPIVESQRALELLQYFKGARVIWAYRNYLDVAKSSIELFGAEPSMFNLSAVLDSAQREHWFSQNLADSTRAVVREHFDPNRPLQDLKCLGWYVRNSLFFQFSLESNSSVTLSRYESLVGDPVGEMRRLYDFLTVAFPGPHVCKHIHTSSVRKGSSIKVSKDIVDLCQPLLERLDSVYEGRKRARLIDIRRETGQVI